MSDLEATSHRIMFVDDEPRVLSGLRRSLKGLRDNWQMEFVDDPAAAMASATTDPRDAVVTDLKMPGIDGLKLLEAIRSSSPGTTRFILSANVRRTFIFEALEYAHRVLLKPCNLLLLDEELDHWLELRAALPAGEILEKIMGMITLPLPANIHNSLNAIADPDSMSEEDISNMVLSCVPLAAESYRLAHGILQERNRSFDSIQDAMSSLGRDGRARLVSAKKKDLFPGDVAQEVLSKLQQHSERVANEATRMAQDTAPDLAKNIASAALLHDLGQFALLAVLGQRYVDICNGEGELCERENSSLGIDHAMLGACLLSMWGASEKIVDAVRLHHTAPADNSPTVARIVHDANIAAHEENGNE